MYNLSYSERLKELEIPSMKYRLLRGDMIHTYKILNEEANNLKHLLKLNSSVITRGHEKRLLKPFIKTECRKHFFSNRVINNWNSLPNDVINATDLNSFKSSLDEHWKHLKYDFDE